MQNCDLSSGLIPFETAKQTLLALVRAPLESESIELVSAVGRIVAFPLQSSINVPSHDNSSMDGFAVCDPRQNLTEFTLIGTIMAGSYSERTLSPGECMRIMTGAPIPKGTTAVEMQERAAVDANTVRLSSPLPQGNNIRKTGEDIQRDQVIFEAGQRLTPIDIGLLASLGISHVEVIKKPSVAVISTGDEVIQPGESQVNGQLYDSNRYTLIAMLQRLPVNILDFGHVKDVMPQLESVFHQAASQADVVITSGGVSVGEADLTKQVLKKLGKIHFTQIAMKPGKPFAFGQLANSYFFGLPGNPVSAAVTMHKLVVPALQQLCGQSPTTPQRLSATLTKTIRKRPGRLDFQRGTMHVDSQGKPQVTPLPNQSSGVLSSLACANCFILVPQDSSGFAAGTEVTVELFDELLK